MRILWVLLIAIGCSTSTAQQVSGIDSKALSGLLKEAGVQLLDVRTPEEVSYGIIEGAITIDFYDPEFDTKMDQLDKQKPVVVYCAAGGRSAKASQKMKEMGFSLVYDLETGFRGWKNDGYPVFNNEKE